MAYDFAVRRRTPLKKAAIKGPHDLEGKKLRRSGVFDASFRLFPAFAKMNGITKWEHVNLTPQLREQEVLCRARSTYLRALFLFDARSPGARA